jgi:hypothetical protein
MDEPKKRIEVSWTCFALITGARLLAPFSWWFPAMRLRLWLYKQGVRRSPDMMKMAESNFPGWIKP